MLPNFLVVGAEKAGTTTLAAMLSQHPEIFVSVPKEPMFFSYHNWDKGISWYEALFQDASDYLAVGEASPGYTWAPYDTAPPKRIYDTLGDIKYVYIVRHPVTRTISQYRHAVFHRWIPADTPFEKALERVPAIKDCSRYFYQIEQYLPYTDRQQWHILVLEELTENTQKVQQDLFRFLGVSDKTDISLPAENVMDQKLQFPRWINYAIRLKRLIPATIYQRFKPSAHQLVGKKIARPDISDDTISVLAREFEHDIKKLSKFCGRDFRSIWGLGRV